MIEQKLIDQVLEQMLQDILNGDLTAIQELIKFIPEINLIAYLPEEVTA
jgi:hypothetical protein